DLSDNNIISLGEESFLGTPNLQDLLLQDNRITHIPANAFIGLGQLQVLALQHNEITEIERDTFLPLISIEDICHMKDSAMSYPSKSTTTVICVFFLDPKASHVI
ncbi:hypothetical protein SK128_020862, partial [Halocaridina rubra]